MTAPATPNFANMDPVTAASVAATSQLLAAAKDPAIYSEGHQRALRWNAAIAMSSLMAQDFVQFLLEEKYKEPWMEGKLWITWYQENQAHMRKYKFFKNQAKAQHEGQDIIIFTEMDTTCINYVLKTDLGNHSRRERFAPLTELRNSTAHGTTQEMSMDDFEEN